MSSDKLIKEAIFCAQKQTRKSRYFGDLFSIAISERVGRGYSKVKLPEVQKIEQFSIECRKNSFKTKTKVLLPWPITKETKQSIIQCRRYEAQEIARVATCASKSRLV